MYGRVDSQSEVGHPVGRPAIDSQHVAVVEHLVYALHLAADVALGRCLVCFSILMCHNNVGGAVEALADV